MTRWCAATALRFFAASAELRLNPLTNSLSANHGEEPLRRKRILPQKHTPPPGWKNPLAPQQPLASARWILGAVAATLLLAVLCVYATFCLLFWQGQWQLVFKPSRTITATPASAGLKYDEIGFDATETGILQLDGWWIPADAQHPLTPCSFCMTAPVRSRILLPQLQALHNLGINIFAFDYRGFGKSVNIHPSQASTYEDADAAWRYLTDTRHLSRPRSCSTGPGWARRSQPRPPGAIPRHRR